jgi:hypothetical protein
MFKKFSNKQRKLKGQIEYLENYQFNDIVIKRFLSESPDSEFAIKGIIIDLKIYFLAVHLKQEQGLILMYDKVVDHLWHTFILDTISYTEFCENVFGEYLHHQLTERCSDKELKNNAELTIKYVDKASKILFTKESK